MLIDGELEEEEKRQEDFNEEYLENFIKRLIKQFKEAFEGGVNYYTVEGITINQINPEDNNHNKDVIELRVHVKYKDKPFSNIFKEGEFTIFFLTNHSSISEFEQKVYENIVNLIVFDGGN